MVSLDDIARMALELPGVTEDEERHGNRSWSVETGPAGGGRRRRPPGSRTAFAWERPFSKADIRRFGDARPPEGPIVAVRVADLHEKESVLAENRDGFFTIPHFEGYAAVLVALPRTTEAAVREAVIDGWLACAPPTLTDGYRAP